MRGPLPLRGSMGDWLLMMLGAAMAGLAGVLVPVTLDRFGADPAVASSVFVTMTTDSMGFLAFLGLGDPTTWSWGRILYEAQQAGAMVSAWWLTLFPSIAILILVLSATLLSIAYNDARNPRHLSR